jgi:hypothetical protein
MKNIHFLFLILQIPSLNLLSQNLNHVPLVILLDTTQTVFGLNQVEITISNLTDSTNVLLNNESGQFEVKMNDTTWIPIRSPMFKIASSPRQKYPPIFRRDTFRRFVDLYSFYFHDSLTFNAIKNNGKQLTCRYSFLITDPTYTTFQRIFSAPITLNIPPANQDDIAAFNYIMARKDTMTILRYLSSDIDNSTEESIPVYQYCIQHFPNSAIATMCALHYSDWLCQGYGFDHKTNQANQLIVQANRSVILSSNIPLLRNRAKSATRCAD